MPHQDDVDAMGLLLERAAKLSNNNPEEFIHLMNEVLFGNIENIEVLDSAGITPKRIHVRINFGDKGLHPLYQDGSEVQMAHFWAYVTYGYFVPKDIAKAGNLIHELIDPPKREGWLPLQSHRYTKGTEEDLRLGVVGINLGQALAKKNLTPKEFAKRIDAILRTDKYNALSPRNIWLGPIPKYKHRQ